MSNRVTTLEDLADQRRSRIAEFVVFPGILVGMLFLTAVNYCWVLPEMSRAVRRSEEVIDRIDGRRKEDAAEIVKWDLIRKRQVDNEGKLLQRQAECLKMIEQLEAKIKTLIKD